MKILPDGTVQITNKGTGETKIIQPNDLPNYGISYTNYQKELNAYKAIQPNATTGLTATQQAQQTKIKDVKDSVDLLEKNLKEVEVSGPLSSSLIGKYSLLNKITGGGLFPQATDYEALRKSLIGPLARSISGEVGVLTDKDIERAEGLLPKATDPKKVRENKLKNLREIIAKRAGGATTTPTPTTKSRFKIEAIE